MNNQLSEEELNIRAEAGFNELISLIAKNMPVVSYILI